MQQQSIPHTWTSNQETQSLTADMCKVKQNKDAVGLAVSQLMLTVGNEPCCCPGGGTLKFTRHNDYRIHLILVH